MYQRKLNYLATTILVILLILGSMSLCGNKAYAATVKLNKTNITISQGESYNLKVTGTNKKVTWSSNNKKILTVSATGKVYGVKSGTAYVTATVNNETYTCKVLVAFPTLEKSNFTLNFGGTRQIVVRNLPKQFTAEDITWESTNEDIAKVDKDGNVTATGQGHATIYVKFGQTTLICSINVPALNDTEVQSFINNLKTEYAEFNNQKVYLITNNIASFSVTYKIEYYDNKNNLVSVSSNSIIIPYGSSGFIYIPNPGKNYDSFKIIYSNLIVGNITTNPRNIPLENVSVAASDTYLYTYQYFDNDFKFDTINMFDVIVTNNTKERINIDVSVVFYKDDKIVDLKHYYGNYLDIGENILKYSSAISKIYTTDYDNLKFIVRVY